VKNDHECVNDDSNLTNQSLKIKSQGKDDKNSYRLAHANLVKVETTEQSPRVSITTDNCVHRNP